MAVLFLCTHNSVRSQMAEGLANALFGDRLQAQSAGTEPAEVHPLAIRAMNEVGIDISGHRSKSLDEFRSVRFDCIVTLCDGAKGSCPFFPGGGVQVHRGFEDPAAVSGSEDERLVAFRRVRDEIRDWLAKELLVGTACRPNAGFIV
jgi:arsenate reductase